MKDTKDVTKRIVGDIKQQIKGLAASTVGSIEVNHILFPSMVDVLLGPCVVLMDIFLIKNRLLLLISFQITDSGHYTDG